MIEEHEQPEEQIEPPKKEIEIQKVFIANYGNLTLEIHGTNEIGVIAYSGKRKEDLFIPWTSIIFMSKTDEDVANYKKEMKKLDEQR